MAKRKTQLDNLYVSMQALTAGSADLLLSCSRFSTCLLPLFAYSETPTTLLSYLVPTQVPRSLAVLLSFPVLGPTFSHLIFIALRIFKQVLQNEHLRHSTSFIELLCPFPPFGLLFNKTNYKWTFNTAFINSRLLAGNHA